MGPGVPPPGVYVPVNSPLESIVQLIVAHPGDGPEANKLPFQLPATSADEYEAAWFVKIKRLEDPLDQVCVHTRTAFPASIWHGVPPEPLLPGAPVIKIPLEENETAPLKLSVGSFLQSVPEPENVPSVAMVSVPLSHHGDEGPERKLV
jgi:hypothetical protein